MSCGNDSQNNGVRRFSKKRIAILSTIGASAAGAAYLYLNINPAIGATIPAVLAFATCPAMCAAMGGTMWLSRRFSKKKDKGQQMQEKQKTKEASIQSAIAKQQEKSPIAVTETNDERIFSFEQSQRQRKKRKTNP